MRRLLLPITLALFAPIASAQTGGATLPAGTPLALRIDGHLPMRVGQPIAAHLVYPVYTADNLILPAGTIVNGSVVSLHANRPRRIHAALGGDLTPFHIPVVQFTQIVLPGGATAALSCGPATDGVPIYRAVSPPPATGGLIHRAVQSGLNIGRGDLAVLIGPNKGDRALQFLYSQLPYHPQRIEEGTAWTIETTTPLEIPPAASVPYSPPEFSAFDTPRITPTRKLHFWEVRPPLPPPPANDNAWIVQAYLSAPLSSETSKTGDVIQATVAEPIYNPDHTIAVPQGATLVGAVTKAKPARRFGRTGVLSFSFRQLEIPDAPNQAVETRLTGADSAANIALNSEGQAKSKPQDKIAVPLMLVLLAARPLDQDHDGRRGGDQVGKNALGGAAGLALVGTVIGLSGASPNTVAGIGYYGAARALYDRWIARGQKIAFPKDTRIVVETTARRSAPIKPDPTR